MNTRPALAGLALLGALATACGSGGEEPGDVTGGPGDQTGATTTYVVTGVTAGGEDRPLVPGSEIRFTFDSGRLGIQAGCNSMSGEYALDGTTLQVGALATTEMGCDQPLMDQDAWVAGLFDGPVELVTGEDAAITSGDVVLTLADRREVHPDKPLVGTKWLLDSIGTGGDDGAVSSVPQGVVAYATFEDGQVLLYDGCNGGSAPLTVQGDTLTVGDRTQTLRGCTGATAEVEKAVGEVFSDEVDFAITEDVLTLTRGDRVLGFRAVEEFPTHQ